MRYFGGKAKIAKPLSEFLNTYTKDTGFVDMFCGSCNVSSKIVAKKRWANDLHYELIAMWKAFQCGRVFPSSCTEEQYYSTKEGSEDAATKGFIGFGCSFSGKWWGGYARDNTVRNYCENALNSTNKKMKTMRDVVFSNGSYLDFDFSEVPVGSVVYCDIPYKDTTAYSTGQFNHQEFYSWAEQKQKEGFIVFVSEYAHNIPDGWEVVWKHESKKDIRDKDGIQQKTVEVLMKPKGE